MALSIEHKLAGLLLQGSLSLALCNAAGAISYPAPMTLMQKGQHHMALGQYSQAEECFRQSAIEHPRDPYVHYYLANMLVYAKKHPQAIEEYNLAFKLDPYGPLSGYCRKALLTYRLHTPPLVPVEETGMSEPISAAERLGLRVPETGEKGAVVQLIRSQTEREKSRHRRFAESIADSIVRGGETRAQIIEKNAHDAINETINSPLRIRPFEHPLTAAENRKMQIEQMRKEAEEAAKMERSIASAKSDAYKRWSLEHEFSLDETASNLEGQLLSKALPGSAHLHAEGTGLFVRYYGRSSEDVDVHNSVAHFTDHRAFEKTDDDEARNEDESGKLLRKLSTDRPEQVRESTVRGAVLKE
jgi:tetratricopeptide (TPR) repeat protein